jgi:hypothetical protein
MATTFPLDEAARRLGVHPATLRRRLHKGLARGVKQQTAQGYVWLVELEDEPAPTSAQANGYAAPMQGPTHDGLAQEMARLSAHVEDLRDQLKAREREVGQLHTLLAQANQRRLTDGQLVTDAEAAPPQPPNGAAQADQWPARRRWWQRLLWS